MSDQHTHTHTHTYRSSGTATAVLVPPPPIPAMAACAHGEKPSIGHIRSIIDNSRVRNPRGFHLDVVVATAVLVVDSNVRNDDVDVDEFHHFLDRIGLE